MAAFNFHGLLDAYKYVGNDIKMRIKAVGSPAAVLTLTFTDDVRLEVHRFLAAFVCRINRDRREMDGLSPYDLLLNERQDWISGQREPLWRPLNSDQSSFIDISGAYTSTCSSLLRRLENDAAMGGANDLSRYLTAAFDAVVLASGFHQNRLAKMIWSVLIDAMVNHHFDAMSFNQACIVNRELRYLNPPLWLQGALNQAMRAQNKRLTDELEARGVCHAANQ